MSNIATLSRCFVEDQWNRYIAIKPRYFSLLLLLQIICGFCLRPPPGL